MTTNGPSDIRILLDDAISEYISDTGDAPHYRAHLLDLLESTLQADPQDTDLVRTPGTVEVSREDLEWARRVIDSYHKSEFGALTSHPSMVRIIAALKQEEPA